MPLGNDLALGADFAFAFGLKVLFDFGCTFAFATGVGGGVLDRFFVPFGGDGGEGSVAGEFRGVVGIGASDPSNDGMVEGTLERGGSCPYDCMEDGFPC